MCFLEVGLPLAATRPPLIMLLPPLPSDVAGTTTVATVTLTTHGYCPITYGSTGTAPHQLHHRHRRHHPSRPWTTYMCRQPAH